MRVLTKKPDPMEVARLAIRELEREWTTKPPGQRDTEIGEAARRACHALGMDRGPVLSFRVRGGEWTYWFKGGHLARYPKPVVKPK